MGAHGHHPCRKRQGQTSLFKKACREPGPVAGEVTLLPALWSVQTGQPAARFRQDQPVCAGAGVVATIAPNIPTASAPARYTRRPFLNQPDPEAIMGRGDKRTRKGKIWRGSFGNSRPKPTKG